MKKQDKRLDEYHIIKLLLDFFYARITHDITFLY